MNANQKKLNVFISGTSAGIGKATAELFLEKGFSVFGFDIQNATIVHSNYTHYNTDISDKLTYPQFNFQPEIFINNAGVQNSGKDIEINLKGSIYFTENYAFHQGIQAVLFVASASAHSGAEFPEYSASKGGLISYMKNAAIRLAKFGAVCNSISPGGVTTELNRPVLENENLWNQIMQVTPLKRWATPKQIAEWIYFLTVVNKNCTGQDILIDNGEKDLNATFVWPEN